MIINWVKPVIKAQRLPFKLILTTCPYGALFEFLQLLDNSNCISFCCYLLFLQSSLSASFPCNSPLIYVVLPPPLFPTISAFNIYLYPSYHLDNLFSNASPLLAQAPINEYIMLSMCTHLKGWLQFIIKCETKQTKYT